MDHRIVEQLEESLENAIAEAMSAMRPQQLPLRPSRHTLQMMAKAAVAVFEAVAENEKR